MQVTRHLALGLAIMLAAGADGAAAADSPRVSRADLGWALLELEQVMDASQLDERMIWWSNRNFDAAVGSFFTSRYSEAIQLIHRITRELLPQEERSPMHDWLRSLVVEIEPRAFAAGHDSDATLIIRSLYAPPPFPLEDAALELRLIGPDDEPSWSEALHLAEYIGTESINARLTIDQSFTQLPSGAYTIELAEPGGTGMRQRLVFILPQPVDEIRAGLLETINDVHDAEGKLERAIRIARARAALLKQRPSLLNSAEFLADLHDLHRALSEEGAALRNGRDPYVLHEGDLWRPVATRATTWPMRVYAPADLDADEPLPLVIGLHGAGGDENMFHNSYGNGVIQRLAETHRFIIASPVTYPLSGDMNLLHELIEEMQRCYPIDEDRVYLIGHSLGAATVSAALLTMPERFAAASCIAGAGRFARDDDEQYYPPVLVIGAEHDFVIPASRVQQQADAGIERGLPIEYRLAEHWGHVLVVGGVLEEVVLWLLDHARN